MLLLAIHVIAITLLVMMVWAMAYRAGLEKGEKRAQRRLETERPSAPESSP